MFESLMSKALHEGRFAMARHPDTGRIALKVRVFGMWVTLTEIAEDDLRPRLKVVA